MVMPVARSSLAARCAYGRAPIRSNASSAAARLRARRSCLLCSAESLAVDEFDAREIERPQFCIGNGQGLLEGSVELDRGDAGRSFCQQGEAGGDHPEVGFTRGFNVSSSREVIG